MTTGVIIAITVIALVTGFWTGVAVGYKFRSTWTGAVISVVTAGTIWAAVTAVVPWNGNGIEFMCGSLVVIGATVGLGQNIGAVLRNQRRGS